jgi:predicted DNA repair protein MutK
MAFTGFFAILDDITTLLDDIASMTKVAAGKTSAIVGDDLALNAKQLVHIEARRELSVVFAVALGSLKNKLILIPAALVMSMFAPFLIPVLLMVGGAYLCFEGAEKVLHHRAHSERNSDGKHTGDPTYPKENVAEEEQQKIQAAIRTDFILSAEIIAIALGSAATAPLIVQAGALTAIGLGMTIVVYGLVAAIVKADDCGLFLIQRSGARFGARTSRALGRTIIRATPIFMKALSILGTLAMFTVGGGIIVHEIPLLHHSFEDIISLVSSTDSIVGGILSAFSSGIAGFLIGSVIVLGTRTTARRAR